MACLEGVHSSDTHQNLRGFAETYVNPKSSEKPSGPELLGGQISMRKCRRTRDFQDLYLYLLGGVMPWARGAKQRYSRLGERLVGRASAILGIFNWCVETIAIATGPLPLCYRAEGALTSRLADRHSPAKQSVLS